jgi:hypothetical protein
MYYFFFVKVCKSSAARQVQLVVHPQAACPGCQLTTMVTSGV